MAENSAKLLIQQLLDQAGVVINGHNPWDIQVHNQNFYRRLFIRPSLTLGEMYVDGWWDCGSLDQFFYRILRADIEEHIQKKTPFLFGILYQKLKNCAKYFFNYQSKPRAFIVGKRHYDIGNTLYEKMLDERLNYSCGYWKDCDNLPQAQVAKLELICQKLRLQPGMRVLDIGCGWGSFAKYAVEKYGVSVVGVTISRRQYAFARESCAGLPIDIRFQDYRDINEQFDRVCSIGMFEHVGYKNYRTYMQIIHRCLPEEGLFLLHTIGSNISTFWVNEWITRYIFPNGVLPSIKQIGCAIEKLFVMEDWHNFGAYYDQTLMAWQHNFSQAWDSLKNTYDERFYRIWNYYLLSCAGAFRARNLQLWQIVLSKRGLPGGYQSIR